MSDAGSKDGPKAPRFLTRHGCAIQGWIVGWAATTFLSAAVETALSESHQGLVGWMNAVLRTADAVPPMAKLTFGALLAIGITASITARRSTPSLITALAIAVVGMAIVLSLPVGYYPAAPAGFSWMGMHLGAAAIGGLIIWMATDQCRRRRRKHAHDRS